MMLRVGAIAFAGIFVCRASSLVAGDLSWPDKSGPTFDGIVAPADAAGIPTEWDEESGRNIAWSITLEGQGHSTPVIGHGKLWLTAADEDGKRQFVYCIDEATGSVFHRKLLFENADPEPLGNPINNYAAPSCVLEDDAVYIHFGTYGTARLDPATAEVVWQRRDLNVRHFRGPGSSPVVFQDLLVLTFDGINAQFVTALDKRSGATVWTTPRSTDYGDLDKDGKPARDGDLRKSYHTPSLTTVAGRTQLISIGSRAAFGYDALTGKEIWTLRHSNFNAAARALFLPEFMILNTGSERASLWGIRFDDTTRGDITESHVVWERKKGNSHLSSPVLVDGNLYFITQNGIAYCVDARTGEELYEERIGGVFVASPIVAGDRIFYCDEDGVTTVVRAAPTFEKLAENHLSEGGRSSPAAARGAIFLRTFHKLYKIAAK
jgi:outer membrane protein assembly factor BamB